MRERSESSTLNQLHASFSGANTALAAGKQAETAVSTPPVVRELSSASGGLRGAGFEIGKKLGQGSFGVVYYAKEVATGNELVIKRIQTKDMASGETQAALRETEILKKLDNKYILKYLGSFAEDENLYIMTEYCDGGDLKAKIKEAQDAIDPDDPYTNPLGEVTIITWFTQLTLAIAYCHSMKILHRDIKPANIFLAGPGRTLKLGDFGLAKKLNTSMSLAQTFAGTPFYMAPEVLKNRGYNSKSDIWSLGCVLYELLSLSVAFQGEHLMAIFYRICDSTPAPIEFDVPEELVTIALWILEKESAKRPNAQDILQSELMKSLIAKATKAANGSSSSSSRRRAASDSIYLNEGGESKKGEEATLTPKQKMELRRRAESDKRAAEAALAAKESHGQKSQSKERHLAQQDSSGVKGSLSGVKRSQRDPTKNVGSVNGGGSSNGVLANSPNSVLFFMNSPNEDEQMTIRDGSGPIGISPRTARRMSTPAVPLSASKPSTPHDVFMNSSDGPESFLASESYMASVRRNLGGGSPAKASTPTSTPGTPKKKPVASISVSGSSSVSTSSPRSAGPGTPTGQKSTGSAPTTPRKTGAIQKQKSSPALGDVIEDPRQPPEGDDLVKNRVLAMRSQAVEILGEDLYSEIYEYLAAVRKENKEPEKVIQEKIKKMVDGNKAMHNAAFLVDQIVFSESHH